VLIFREYRTMADRFPEVDFDMLDLSEGRVGELLNRFWHQTHDHEKRLGCAFASYLWHARSDGTDAGRFLCRAWMTRRRSTTRSS
jgi:hypothetical protein